MDRKFQTLAIDTDRKKQKEKETVNTDILVASGNDNRKIMQSIRTSLENNEVEQVEPVQMNIYQSNTYRKELRWLHFDDEPRVQGRQQVYDQQFCISVFVGYLTIPIGNWEHQPRHDSSIPCIVVCQIYRDTQQPQEKETYQNQSRLQFSWRQLQQQG